MNPGFITPVRIATAVVALLTPLLPIPISGMVAVLVGLHALHMLIGLTAWFRSDQAGRMDVH